MSVGDWLNSAIIQSAADDGVHLDDPAPQDAPVEELVSINDRLDGLSQQLQRVMTLMSAPPQAAARTPDDWGRRHGMPQYAPAPLIYDHAYAPQPQPVYVQPQPAHAALVQPQPVPVYQQPIQLQPQPLPAYVPPPPVAPQPPPDLMFSDALAEIAARQRALDAEPISAFQPAPSFPPPPPPAPAFSVPVFHQPPIPAERPATHAAPQAPFATQPSPPPAPPPMPAWPTQDLSGLEAQLRQITTQIESLHGHSVDSALDGLRQELSEIARTLLDAMPRRAIEALENDVRLLAGKIDQTRQGGVDPAIIAGMEQGLAQVYDALRGLQPAENLAGFADAVTGLSHKLDHLIAQQDPSALHQLDAAIEALRGIVAHVASNEALARLSDDMRMLAAKIDQVGASAPGMSHEAFSALESRIATLTDQLRARSEGATLPPQLDSVIRALTERLEHVQLSPGDNVALGHLEDRIVHLVEKLDASEARLNHLGAVERGLADLLVHIEELRAERRGSGLRETAHVPAVDTLQREVERTQDSIEDVHGTLGHVVDRLAQIETDMRGEAPRPTVTAGARPVVVNPIPVEPTAKPAVERPNPVALDRPPIDPNLPPDYPIEPGSGTPPMRAVPTAAERIAASEAALGASKPIAANVGHTNFIAAARRAAHTAKPGATITPAPDEAETPEDDGGSRKTMGKRVRSLLAGLSAVVLIFAVAKVATNFLDRPESPVSAPAEPAAAQPAQPMRQSENENAKASPKLAAPVVSAPLQTALTAPALTIPVPALTPPAAQATPSAPSLAVPSDVTGSIARPQAAPAPAAASFPALPLTPVMPAAPALEATKFPQALRTAIDRGDSAGAYEAGLRYLEGRGVAVNLDEAARWLEKAAKAGLAPAQFRLGSLYEKGQGVKKDLTNARKYYLAAAEKGNAKAMHNLAVLYAEGYDGKPDYKTAAYWFRMGAERGVPDSQYNLGILCARGIGTEQNLADSYKWFALAANSGDKESARKRDEVAQRLDQQSLIAARLAVQTWVAEPQPDEAVNVKGPPGGWDAAPAPAKKQRASGLIKVGAR